MQGDYTITIRGPEGGIALDAVVSLERRRVASAMADDARLQEVLTAVAVCGGELEALMSPAAVALRAIADAKVNTGGAGR